MGIKKLRAQGNMTVMWRKLWSACGTVLCHEPLLQGCWAITGFAKMCLAVPFLPLGFLCVSEPRYTDFRSKEPPSMPWLLGEYFLLMRQGTAVALGTLAWFSGSAGGVFGIPSSFSVTRGRKIGMPDLLRGFPEGFTVSPAALRAAILDSMSET